MRILICDDSESDAQKLASLIRASGAAAQLTLASGPLAALERVRDAAPDVCFLDILMPGMKGTQLAEALRQQGYRGEIVFLTASNDFAHESYRVGAFDYLLKPPTRERVDELLARLQDARGRADGALLVRAPGGAGRVPLGEISHVEVIDHTVHIRLASGRDIEQRATFNEVVAPLLTDRRFVQCHRSYVVNMAYIEAVTERALLMKGGRTVPISRGFQHVRDELLKWMFGRDV